ncbi:MULTISPECIES: tetratricopeptide repeat protein [unclassified Brevundimonas]|uniref:tetratricopeptide repeat protein n=1 Tax=unclassified Brevundimonas TaxID=2622653 RepID=UPI0025BF10E1|nr:MULTISPECIES: tetratricopeptide repeat protein [unclassified Brevundimonas]
MSRTRCLAATISLIMGLPLASGALAQTVPEAVAPRLPADAATRAAYDRTDALSRSVFWGNEHAINPMDPVAGVKMAQALRELGQFDRAAETAEAVVTAQPNNLEAMLEIGRAHIARGQAFYGINALERAREIAPRDWRPLSLLGVAYQQVRRADDANAAWHAGLSISPDQPEILTNMAIARMGAGNLVEAENYLRRAAAQPGASLQVRQNLALALGLQGKTAEAETILRRDLPPETVDHNLAWLARRTEEMRSTVQPAQPAQSSPTARSWDSLNR